MPAFFSSLKLKEVCSFQPRHESRISREFMKAVYTKTLTETKEDVFRLALSRRIFPWFFFSNLFHRTRHEKSTYKFSRVKG